MYLDRDVLLLSQLLRHLFLWQSQTLLWKRDILEL